LRIGAIAQMGERVNGIHEVGGSIPPGSTSLRSLRELRLGKPPLGAAFLCAAQRGVADSGRRGIA
jgi:hypothetical protein